MRSLQDNVDVEVVPQTDAQFAAALTLYAQRPDKEWGITDYAAFLTMQERGITEALAYDDHFYQASFILCVTADTVWLSTASLPRQKRKGWSSMPQRSSGSVKVFYPPWTRDNPGAAA